MNAAFKETMDAAAVEFVGGSEGLFELSRSCVASAEYEVKYCGVLVWSQLLKARTAGAVDAARRERVFAAVEDSIDASQLANWGLIDFVSSRVLAELVVQNPALFADRLHAWRLARDNLWKQRAACVSFVRLARFGEHSDTILSICEETVCNPERFAQLGTGWVLRELWLAEPERVLAFLRAHFRHLSREGLRYAVEKMPHDLQRTLLAEHKDALDSGAADAPGPDEARRRGVKRTERTERAPSPMAATLERPKRGRPASSR